MVHNHKHFNKLEDKTKPNLKDKKRIKSKFQYPANSEYTEIQFKPVNQRGQDQTPPYF